MIAFNVQIKARRSGYSETPVGHTILVVYADDSLNAYNFADAMCAGWNESPGWTTFYVGDVEQKS